MDRRSIRRTSRFLFRVAQRYGRRKLRARCGKGLHSPNRRFGSCLALAALALQLVLSFGHVHLDGVHRASLALALSGWEAQASQPPAPHPGNDADDDYCTICATIFLAANSFLPPAPQLPVPSVSQTIECFDHVPVAHRLTARAISITRSTAHLTGCS